MSFSQYKLHLWTQFSVFHDSAEHWVDIDVDGVMLFQKTFSPKIVHHVKLDEHFDFELSGVKKITISWNSEHETADKYLMFDKWAINNQKLTAYQCMYLPNENEYMKNISQHGSIEEKQNLRKQIMFAGNRFGWFGKLVWEFVLGNSVEIKKTLIENSPEHIFYMNIHKIFLDPQEAKTYDRISKKN